MGHDHSHSTAAQAHRGRLLAVLVLTLVVLVVEVVGGLVSGSFALIADAGHMLTDAAGVGLDNDEQGTTVWTCSGLRASWATLWPEITHLG